MKIETQNHSLCCTKVIKDNHSLFKGSVQQNQRGILLYIIEKFFSFSNLHKKHSSLTLYSNANLSGYRNLENKYYFVKDIPFWPKIDKKRNLLGFFLYQIKMNHALTNFCSMNSFKKNSNQSMNYEQYPHSNYICN